MSSTAPEGLRVGKIETLGVCGDGFSGWGMEAKPSHKGGHGLWDYLILLPWSWTPLVKGMKSLAFGSLHPLTW